MVYTYKYIYIYSFLVESNDLVKRFTQRYADVINLLIIQCIQAQLQMIIVLNNSIRCSLNQSKLKSREKTA